MREAAVRLYRFMRDETAAGRAMVLESTIRWAAACTLWEAPALGGSAVHAWQNARSETARCAPACRDREGAKYKNCQHHSESLLLFTLLSSPALVSASAQAWHLCKST